MSTGSAGKHRLAALAATVAALALTATACSSSKTSSSGGASGGSAATGAAASLDDGAQLTMWTRAGTQTQTQGLVDAYNATHKNHVNLTVYDTDPYAAKITAAAGAKSLPDVFTSDVVFSPNYVNQGLWADITDRFNAQSFAKSVSPSEIKAASANGKIYAVPHAMDLSVMFYNTNLYKQAGLDPTKPPTTLQEFATQARAVAKLGGDVHGTYFGGACGGCVEFTFWPSIWADGGQVMNDAGTTSTLDSPQSEAVFKVYHDLFADGTADPASKAQTGATWQGALESGKIGIAPGPSSWLPDLEQKVPGIAVAPIPGVNGGTATFTGGDVAGISATSKHQAEAWNFLSWTLSDDAQVGVLAKAHEIIARTDLVNNQYAATDPNVVVINTVLAHGQTPFAINFNASYNDAQSPWNTALQAALYGNDIPKALKDGQSAITASLGG
jgi:multiple sugar transport system substrate-binding protein